MWVAAAIGGSALLGAGASIFGAETQSNAATQAAQLQAAASGNAATLQQQEADKALQAQQGYFNTSQAALQPFINSGSGALPTLSKLLTPGADMSSVLAQIPGFQFAQQYGQKAITNQATSRGISGNALTAGADYATGSANQTYTGIVQALLAQAGLGSGAAGSLAGAAGGASGNATSTLANAGSQIGASLTGIGQAQAAGTLGSANAQATGATGVANAVSGGVNSGINLSLLQSLLKNNQGGSSGLGIFSGGGNNGAAPAWVP